MRRALAWSALVVAGCGEVPPFVPYDHDAVLRAALARNATLVAKGDEVTTDGGVPTSHDLQSRAQVVALAGGAFVAALTINRPEVATDAARHRLALIRSSATGVRAKALEATRAALLGLGDEAFVVTCGASGQLGFVTDGAAGFVELQGVPPPCVSVLGRGAAADQAIAYTGNLARVAIDRAARTVSFEAYEPKPPRLPAVETVRLVEEPSAGEIGFVTVDGGTLSYVRGDTSTPAVGIDGLDGAVQVFRGADGALRVATTTGLFRWDVATAPTRLADVPPPPSGVAWRPFDAPGGAYAWIAIPNPLAPKELQPTGATVRWATDTGFVTLEAPPTPCCDDKACRRAAESYVIGGFGDGAARVVFYDLWSWVGKNQHALVVAGVPLSCGTGT